MAHKITGIGGIFFKCKDPDATRAWYKEYLGIEANEYGYTFTNEEVLAQNQSNVLNWNPFNKTTDYLGDPEQQFMINYKVENLADTLKSLAVKGVKPIKPIEEFEYGKFAWIKDNDGRRVELWQPADLSSL